jgi:hypothetical protein
MWLYLKGEVSFEDGGEAIALELADLGHDRLLVVGRDVVEVDLGSIFMKPFRPKFTNKN